MAEPPFTDAELDAYLDESAPADRTAEIEAALRADEPLRERLAEMAARRDAGLHSLGAVWRRHRLTCPTREQLGSYLLGVLPTGLDDYVRFHLKVVACPLCLASVEDLRERHESDDRDGASRDRRERYFRSSVGRVDSDTPE